MLGIGIVVGILGYSLVFWGDQLWNGCSQNTLLDLMWPGGTHFKPCAPASSSPGGLTLTSAQKKAYQVAATAPGTPHR